MFQILFFEDKRERKTIWNHGGVHFSKFAKMFKLNMRQKCIYTLCNQLNRKYALTQARSDEARRRFYKIPSHRGKAYIGKTMSC